MSCHALLANAIIDVFSRVFWEGGSFQGFPVNSVVVKANGSLMRFKGQRTSWPGLAPCSLPEAQLRGRSATLPRLQVLLMEHREQFTCLFPKDSNGLLQACISRGSGEGQDCAEADSVKFS